ncbi:MAG: hypothetical protein JKX76_01250 [Colwellia sp.]|nr:hypothetical protein [Colwellia sp.]
MGKFEQITLSVVVAVVVLALVIVQLVGLGYLSVFSFNAESTDGEYCVTMTKSQKNLTTIALIMIWGAVITMFVGSLMVMLKKNGGAPSFSSLYPMKAM